MTGVGKGLQPEGLQPKIWKYAGLLDYTAKCSTTGCYSEAWFVFVNTKSFHSKWKTLVTHSFCRPCMNKMNRFLREQIND